MKIFARLVSVATLAVTTSAMAASPLQPMSNAELDKVSAGTLGGSLINVAIVDVVDVNKNTVQIAGIQSAINILGVSKQLQKTVLPSGCGCY